MIYASNVDQVAKDLEAFLLAAERKATLKFKVITGYALKWLAMHSPQFSGDFAANWKVSLNGIDASFTPDAVTRHVPINLHTNPGGIDAYKQGDMPAVAYAIAKGAAVINGAKIGDYLTLANSAIHDEAYAYKIENNQIKFRPENHEGGRVIGRFIESFRNLPV